MRLYFDTNAPAVTLAVEDTQRGMRTAGMPAAAQDFHIGTDTSVFDLGDTRHLVALLPAGTGAGMLRPVTVQMDAYGRIEQPCAACRTVDWGGGVTELCADLPVISRAINSPALLQRMSFPARDGKRRETELYSDNGIRLNVIENGNERSFLLCGGTEGSMRVLDVGRERLLTVHVMDGETERIIALDGNFEVAASIEGARCSIDDGYLTAIAPLGTVLGHERRTRYELRAGRLERLPDEVGFFGAAPMLPSDATGISLAFMEAVMLRRRDEAERLLDAELAEALDFDDICGFFGELDECRPAPWQGVAYDETADASVVLGAVKDGRAKKFTFTVSGGRVTDITEE